MCKLIDLTGKRFGRWEVLSRADNVKGRVMWNCKCECGTLRVVQGTSLKNGVSKSCGCGIKRIIKHGKSDSNIYKVWQRIKGCTRSKTHQDYNNYGGRGIDICESWYSSFNNFYDWSINNGYEEGLEIDRIDNNDDYKPSNCRWTTRTVNTRNTRFTRYVTLNGVKKPLIQWCEELGLNYNTIYARIYDYGWCEERALLEEIK